MRKKMISLFLLALLIAPMTGCATVQKKFTRKKKEPAHIPAAIYFEEGPYQKKYSNVYYYKTHYTLWKTWHEDLLKVIGGNRLKLQRCAEESLNHLTQMRGCLVPEKQKELDPLLKQMTDYVKKIDLGAYSRSEEAGMRTELQKLKRLVDNDFYYDKVAGQILPDTVNLAASPAPLPVLSSAPLPTPVPSPIPSPSASAAKVQ